MTWYADTSAIVKLVREEVAADAYKQWSLSHDVVSCDLLRTEARRAVAGNHRQERAMEAHLNVIPMMTLGGSLFDQAGRLPGTLRSLDAIHLAAALAMGSGIDGIVTYDTRLADAATAAGLTVASPT